MVKIDFSSYRSLYNCPKWWQNYINFTIESDQSLEDRHNAIQRGLDNFNGIVTGLEKNDAVMFLEFETEEDFESFKLYWMLHGS